MTSECTCTPNDVCYACYSQRRHGIVDVKVAKYLDVPGEKISDLVTALETAKAMYGDLRVEAMGYSDCSSFRVETLTLEHDMQGPFIRVET